MQLLRKITEFCLLTFVFLLPWQTKLILQPADNAFNEISLYASHLALLLALIFFLAYQLLQKKWRGKTALVWYFLGIMEIFILISFFFAPDKLLAAYHYFVFLGGLGLFYLLREGMRFVPYEESCLNRARAIFVFLSSMLLQSVLGVYQFLSQSTFANKYLGLAAHDSELAGTSVIETVSGRWLRAYGGLDHPNIFGGVLVFVLLLAAFSLVRKRIISSQLQVWSVLILLLNYFLGLAALFFTFSRAAWLAYAVGMIILLISVLYKEERWVAKRLLALILFSAILFLTAVLPYRELIFTRIEASSRLEQNSISERQDYLKQAGVMIKNQPFFGVGVGNYVKKADIIRQTSDYRSQPVHNAFILVLAESGIFAFWALLLFMIFMAKDKKRQTFSLAIVAALVVLMMFDHWLFSLPFGVLFFFLILGVI